MAAKEASGAMQAARHGVIRLALVLAALTPLYFLVAALGVKLGLLDWRIGYTLMTVRFGLPVLIGVAALALVSLVLAVAVRPRASWRGPLIALVVPLIGLGAAFYIRAQAAGAPPIHDITTDFVDPPTFSQAVMAARSAVGGANPVAEDARVPEAARFGEWSGMRVRDIQRNEHRDILPIRSPLSPEETFDSALEAARGIGLRIGVQDRADGRIEGAARTFWFGFVDDVVIRIRPSPTGAGAIVDVRSVSRVRLSDYGANARRVRAFTRELNDRLAR